MFLNHTLFITSIYRVDSLKKVLAVNYFQRKLETLTLLNHPQRY